MGHGWNLYVVDTVTPLALYQEMVTTTLPRTTRLYPVFLSANWEAEKAVKPGNDTHHAAISDKY